MSAAESALSSLDPARTALLVIDPQNAFGHPQGTLGISGVDVASAQRAIPAMRDLIEAFRAAKMPVVWTVQVHIDPDHSRARKRLAGHTSRRKRVSALAGSWDGQIVDELADLADDPTYVVEKHRYGAFYETRLDVLLRMLGCDALVVCGLTANACVETTLREAYLRDYDAVAVTDAIGVVRPEWEEVAQAVWRQYFCELAETAEVTAWLERAIAPGVVSLGHLLIECADLDKSSAFYLDLLGMTVRKREDFRDGRPLIVTEQGVGLTSGRREGPGPLEHVALRVRRLEQLLDRVRAAGVEIVQGPEPSSYGTSAYLLDPDGNKVELFEPALDGRE